MEKLGIPLNQCITAIPGIRDIVGNKGKTIFYAVELDSRKVRPGSLYVAIKGQNSNGHHWIKSAIKNGAVAVIGMETLSDSISVPYIRVEDSRIAMAYAAAALYDFPAKDMVMIGVTGTDGKTTTATYLYHILRKAGFKAGLISTVSAIIDGQELDTGFHVTTPESPDTQRYLAQMQDAGITHVIIEATSHGLAQQRIAAINFDIAIVTNITHEHLDFHHTREEYFSAKGILFENLGKTKRRIEPLAILNYDDRDSYDYLKKITSARTIAYSASAEKEHCLAQLTNAEATPSGTQADVIFRNVPAREKITKIPICTKLIGLYNCSNLLAAMTAAIYGLGIDVETAASGVADVAAIPGRMEAIDYGQNFSAIVDFAHTPNALKNALESARKMLTANASAESKNRILAVYGSAGLRDREKRRMMPQISARLADITILTAEDPRTEPLSDILNEMKTEAEKYGAVMGESLFIERDRRQAIRLGIAMAKPGDIVLALGKGHEQSMCFGDTEYLWDDRTAMRAALCEMLNIDGPEMPFLPDEQI